MHIYINTFGTYLAKRGNNFAIISKDGERLLSPDKVSSFSLAKGVLISSEAAMLAIDNNIDIFFIDAVGKPLGRIWSNKFGSVTTIRRNQIDFTFSPQAVKWIKDILVEKINNQVALLLTLKPQTKSIENQIKSFINKQNDYKNKIASLKAQNISEIASTLRGWEGIAGRAYFSAIALILPDKYKFTERSQHPAKDIFNAMLNYGYGMLYGKIEAELIKAGIDPYVGVFHRENYNRPVLVFDIIEKYRVWVDYVVINLLMFDAIDDECFSVNPDDNSVWLENLGRRIVAQSVNDFLEEKIKYKNKKISRANIISDYCKHLASVFHKFKTP